MIVNLSRSINLGIILIFMLMISGVCAAEELNVNFVSQYYENSYSTSGTSVTNAILTEENFVGHRGGSISNVVVDGNYAYVGQGQDLVILDVTDVTNPIEKGRITTPSVVNNVIISGNYAYVANAHNGLAIIDISDPTAPTISARSTSIFGSGVALSGNYAYVASGVRGLTAIDVTNPAAPIRLGNYNTSGYSYKVAVNGSYAYVADDTSGLVILDITNPSIPIFRGQYDTEGSAIDVTVSGNYAYVADGSEGLLIIDITDSTAPVLTGTYNTDGIATAVTVSGNYAYVADRSNGLVIIDITDPATPTLAGTHRIASSEAFCVDVSNNYAYVAYGRSGLSILDVTNPATPTIVGTYDTTAGFANGVAISGNYAYIANGLMGLTIVDITNPATPIGTGNYITTGYAHDVTVSGNYAYLADGRGGLQIIDVSNPASPTLTGSYTTGGHAFGVAISENYAYVAYNTSGLVIVNITNPAAPVPLGSYDTAGNSRDVVVVGNYAYVADGENGLVIIDINNPTAPTQVGVYDTPGNAYGVAVSGNLAYVADGSSGLTVLDVTNPTAPTFVSNYETNFAHDIEVYGNYAYIADDSHGLMILNVTNPASPELAGSYNTAGYAYDVAVSGNYVYIADFGNGLVILHVENESNVPDTIPPASVTDLKATNTDFNWIRWTWSNPLDADFSHVMIYIDGLFVTNTSEGYYNLTGLTENSTHTISTKTVDTSGNINPSWVNDSATATIITTDTIPPASVTNLDAIDSDSTWIYWTWDNPIDEDFSYVMIYLDGAFVTNTTNSSINYYNATGLSEGSNYTLGIRTVDSSGNINSTFVNDSAVALKLPKLWNISGRDITKDSITLVWEASNDTTEVQIIRDDVVLGNVDGSTSYADSGLSSGRTYTYTLIPYNNNSVAGKAVTVDLTTRSSSGGGGSSRSSSSGGGGGGSASVEDFANLAMKDTASKYLRMDTNVTYLFTREGNPVESISFYSLKNAGQITATVEVLNDMSKLVNSTPEGLLYKYVNIWVGKAGFATADNIKDAYIRFKVNTSWMEQMEINPEDVSLQRYNGTSWEVLPTVMENSTDNYIIFKSQTPGFSPFAITAEKSFGSAVSTETEPQSNVKEDITPPAEEKKTPGFEAFFAVAGMLAVVYFVRRR